MSVSHGLFSICRGLAMYGARINQRHRPVIDLDKLHRDIRNDFHETANHIHIGSEQHQRLAV